MPKMKTQRGAAKRFRFTARGKVVRNKAYDSHLLTKKSAKRKRNLGKKEIITTPGEVKRVRKMLPYG
ncbi:MAG: 50S ribosomal protein L35 [Acidobacteria bacterium]|nr:50S ribosomal protein L35 [Acidobacteriota bacterium]